MTKQCGPKIAGKLKQRLWELSAADTLDDISHLPPPRLHELTNRHGTFSVDLDATNRLLFVVAEDPVPLLSSGGIDKSQIGSIEITAIEDTHDPKVQRRGGR